ncbi:hypothetical protein [Mixta calida]|uniref:hypothetical protein n=1 Tax=Mixta calida TaxID=665913 RepID=UPI0034D4C2F1
MWKIKYPLRNADAGADAAGGGDPGIDAGNATPAAGNSTGESLLSTGAENSATTETEQQAGSGAPESPDDYAPEITSDAFSWEEFKDDPAGQEFLKAAHAKGITNDQLGFILNEYAQRAPALVNGAAELDADAAATQLRETWKTDAEFNKNIGLAYRAFNSLADEADKGRMDEIGNNPLVIRMLAKIGAEMQEDTPVGAGASPQEQQAIKDLMKSPAYTDPKHPDHQRISAQVRAFYQKAYGNTPVA